MTNKINYRHIKTLFFLLIVMIIGIPRGYAYEIWIGTSCTPHNAAVKTETWWRTASLVSGLNINLADVKPDPGTPSENETACDDNDWKVIFTQYGEAAQNGMVPIPRSAIKSDAFPDRRSIEEHLPVMFTKAERYGYVITSFMIYDNALTVDGKRTLFNWTSDEIYNIRNWLNNNDFEDISIIYNARNFSEEVRDKCTHPAVGEILLESEPGKWYENAGSRQDLLKWLTTDYRTKNKRYIFQIPVSGVDHPFGNPSGYQQVRRMIRWLGTDLMDMDFMRSSNVIFLPVTYNYPTFTFYPETESNERYANTLTGIVLSLIEQKDLFEGRKRIPTVEDADSYVRTQTDPTVIFDNKYKVQPIIFPNPLIRDRFYIRNSENTDQPVKIEFINCKGVLVNWPTPENIHSGIDISGLIPGLYFVRIHLSDGIITRKIIVPR